MTKGEHIPCAVCGRAPTRSMIIRRHVGVLFYMRFISMKGPLCRDHGAEAAKSYLGRTLLQGWWGIISVFVNMFDVCADVRAFVAYKRLPSPPPYIVQPPGTRPQMRRFDGSALPTPF